LRHIDQKHRSEKTYLEVDIEGRKSAPKNFFSGWVRTLNLSVEAQRSNVLRQSTYTSRRL